MAILVGIMRVALAMLSKDIEAMASSVGVRLSALLVLISSPE
jgi:hypothetical protein